MPYQPLGKYASRQGFIRKTDFKQPVTFYDRVRFVGSDSSMEIFGGTLDGADISVGTITIDRLIIGSFGNLMSDPGFESGNSPAKSIHTFKGNGGTWTVTSLGKHSGDFGARYDPNGQSGAASITFGTNHFSCVSGDTFYVSAWHEYGSGSGVNDSMMQTLWYDSDDVFVGASSSIRTPISSQVLMTGEHTAPSAASYGVFTLNVLDGGGSRISLFDDVVVRRKVGTLVIEGQAVDIERMLDPVFTETGWAFNAGFTLTTSFANLSLSNNTVTVPSWVGTLSCFAVGTLRGASWGVTQRVSMAVKIAGTSGSFFETTIVSGEYSSPKAVETEDVVTPGATVSFTIRAMCNGTNETAVLPDVNFIVVGVR